MDLTPKDIQEKQFHDSFRGYNQEEVDLFLDQCAESFEKIFRENQTFHHRLRELEQQLAEARATEDMLKQMLLAAQKTAEEAVEGARARAQEMVQGAEKRAKQMIDSAEARQTELIANAKGRAAEIMNAAQTREREIRAVIESLRSFDRDYRERLRSFMESNLRSLSELSVPAEPVVTPQQVAAMAEAGPGPVPVDAGDEEESSAQTETAAAAAAIEEAAPDLPDDEPVSAPMAEQVKPDPSQGQVAQAPAASRDIDQDLPPLKEFLESEPIPEDLPEEPFEVVAAVTQQGGPPEDRPPTPARKPEEERSIKELFWGSE